MTVFAPISRIWDRYYCGVRLPVGAITRVLPDLNRGLEATAVIWGFLSGEICGKSRIFGRFARVATLRPGWSGRDGGGSLSFPDASEWGVDTGVDMSESV